MPNAARKSPQSALIQKELIPRSPLTREDWDFSIVPDPELVPCLLWEFLRESETAHRFVNEWKLREEKLGPPNPNSDPEYLERINRCFKNFRFKINHAFHQNLFIYSALNGNVPFSTPWKKIPAEPKQLLKDGVLIVERPVAIVPPFGFFPMFDDQSETFRVRVRYGLYDDNAIRHEITTKFADAIIKCRPKGVAPQARQESGKGRNSEWRGMLNSLGLARLAGRYTARQLQTEMPEVYRHVAESRSDKVTSAVQNKLRDASRRFRKRFQEILPFEKRPPLCLRRPNRSQ